MKHQFFWNTSSQYGNHFVLMLTKEQSHNTECLIDVQSKCWKRSALLTFFSDIERFSTKLSASRLAVQTKCNMKAKKQYLLVESCLHIFNCLSFRLWMADQTVYSVVFFCICWYTHINPTIQQKYQIKCNIYRCLCVPDANET